jgi:MFS superfamily sulfate permease-like transporter
VDGNQEFLAIGIANIVGCFFSAYPLAASLSRSAVNVASGAHTALSGIISTLLVLVSLLFLAPVVYCIHELKY